MKIDVIQGDITEFNGDAIVNAANTNLVGGSGVSGAIFRAAGDIEMTRACQKIGHCNYGDAVITSGFKLPAKWVVHTVGPVYGQHGGAEPDILRSCYWESLRLAESKKLKSIAFPIISAGFYGYPIEQAIKIAIEAIYQFFDDNPDTSIENVAVYVLNEKYKILVDKICKSKDDEIVFMLDGPGTFEPVLKESDFLNLKNEFIELAKAGEQTVSRKYTIGYLMVHPQTKAIMAKYFDKYKVKDIKIKTPWYNYIGGTLDEMRRHNMGGGMKYKDITNLMKELDEIKIPLNHEYSDEEAREIFYKSNL